MTLTEMQVKSAKNPPESIIDKTPKEPFISPLQRYIQNFCEQGCDFWKGKCRLHDQNGLKNMALCIDLYIAEIPLKMLQSGKITTEQPEEADVIG